MEADSAGHEAAAAADVEAVPQEEASAQPGADEVRVAACTYSGRSSELNSE